MPSGHWPLGDCPLGFPLHDDLPALRRRRAQPRAAPRDRGGSFRPDHVLRPRRHQNRGGAADGAVDLPKAGRRGGRGLEHARLRVFGAVRRSRLASPPGRARSRAAETAILTAAHLLRTAEPTNDGRVRFEGEILTAELVRHAMAAELLAQGAEGEEILVQSGPAALGGHELGRGPILPDEAVVIDCFPRDRRTGVYTDMTRTFVPGRPSPSLADLHAHCRAALDVALESIRPGANDAYARVADYFESRGFVTQRTHDGSGPLTTGFSHGLGHGVGLEVHERPLMGRRSDELMEGDVIAIEPGLYIEEVGGVRLEDTVLVTDDGAMHFTDPFPYDLQP